jgi:hypothetical protein
MGRNLFSLVSGLPVDRLGCCRNLMQTMDELIPFVVVQLFKTLNPQCAVILFFTTVSTIAHAPV